MSEVYDLKKARKKKQFATPVFVSRISEVLGLPMPEGYTHYTLRTRRFGVEVGLCAQVRWSNGQETGHWINLSHLNAIYPKNFAAARLWVRSWADRHGMELIEKTRPRSPRPSRSDNELLKAGGCREEWLSSDVPKLWAEAAVRCQHAGAYCGQDGFCHYGNCDMEMNEEKPREADEA